MKKLSKRAKRRVRGKSARAISSLDAMHMALGEFMTEIARLEFAMLLLVDQTSEPPIEYWFDEYAKLTFGPKTKWLEERCNASATLDDYDDELERIYEAMKTLTKLRNYLVHGETYVAKFKGRRRAAYRVGVRKDDIDYLDDFEHQKHGDNVFDIEKVSEAAKFCTDLRSRIGAIRRQVSANAVPYAEVSDKTV